MDTIRTAPVGTDTVTSVFTTTSILEETYRFGL